MKIIQIQSRPMIYNFSGKEFFMNPYQKFLVPDFIVASIYKNHQEDPQILIPNIYEVEEYKNYFKMFNYYEFIKKPDNILISRTGGLGDLLLLSSLVYYFRKKFKKIKIYFSTLPKYFELLKLFDIDGYFPIICPISKIKKIVRYIISFEGKIENEKLLNWYELTSRLVHYKLTKPYIKKIPQKYLNKYKALVNKNKFNIFVHYHAGYSNRKINPFFLASILKKIKTNDIEFIFSKFKNEKEKNMLVNEYKWRYIYTPTIIDLFALVSICNYVISVDTVIPHFCGAIDKPFLGIFGPFSPELRITTYKNADWIVPNKTKVKEICEEYPCKIHGSCKINKDYGECFKFIEEEIFIQKIKGKLK